MSEKKVVGRNVAIALGIVCVLLIVGLGGVFAYFSMNNPSNTAKTWENQYNAYVSSHNHSNDEYNSLQTNNNDLNQKLNLQKQEDWAVDQTVNQEPGHYTTWDKITDISGYVLVNVKSSTTSKTFVRVLWSSYGVNYDQEINVGAGGIAYFPVLPTSNVEVRVGNHNPSVGATETVTITYFY